MSSIAALLISRPWEHTFSPEHWLRFPRLSSLLLLTGPEVFTGFFPFGVSTPPQFILLLVILFVFIADRLFTCTFRPSSAARELLPSHAAQRVAH